MAVKVDVAKVLELASYYEGLLERFEDGLAHDGHSSVDDPGGCPLCFVAAEVRERIVSLEEAIRGCVEHMEWSTEQGRGAYMAALAAIRGEA